MLVSKNTVTNNTSGIRLSTIAYNSSMKSVIIGNIIANNTYGIITPGLNYYATICGNTIANNQYGMHFRWVRSYGIYHNNFVNNTKQVYSYETTAEWDNGYPSGGNHWDDYNGEDSKSGPRQNRTGSDGVGDTPYVVDENNTDTYPLMKPWTPILGDVSFDDEVGILDITSIASIYGSREIEPCWNPEADLAPPYGKIDILDLVTCTGHCGEKYP
jgi:nitrous oxidase accessory protein NosD